MTSQPHYTTTVRLPVELRNWVADQAAQGEVSFNAMIVSLIESRYIEMGSPSPTKTEPVNTQPGTVRNKKAVLDAVSPSVPSQGIGKVTVGDHLEREIKPFKADPK